MPFWLSEWNIAFFALGAVTGAMALATVVFLRGSPAPHVHVIHIKETRGVHRWTLKTVSGQCLATGPITGFETHDAALEDARSLFEERIRLETEDG